MGMYTELIFSARLQDNLNEDVINDIEYLCGNKKVDENKTTLPDVLLKSIPLLRGRSYGLAPSMPPIFKRDEYTGLWELVVRCSLKNYRGQIERFLEWVKPHIYSASGFNGMYAITMYEDDNKPSIYYLYDRY